MVATFSETRAFISTDHLEKRVWEFQNDQRNLLQSYYSGCFSVYFPQKLWFLTGFNFLKKTFVATSSEACALTSRKCFAEEGKNFRKWSENK